jgi:hypothetical protein
MMGRRRLDEGHRPLPHHPAHFEPVREDGLRFAACEELDGLQRPNGRQPLEVLHAPAEDVHGARRTQELITESHQRLPVAAIAHDERLIGRHVSTHRRARRTQEVPTVSDARRPAATIAAGLETAFRCRSRVRLHRSLLRSCGRRETLPWGRARDRSRGSPGRISRSVRPTEQGGRGGMGEPRGTSPTSRGQVDPASRAIRALARGACLTTSTRAGCGSNQARSASTGQSPGRARSSATGRSFGRTRRSARTVLVRLASRAPGCGRGARAEGSSSISS